MVVEHDVCDAGEMGGLLRGEQLRGNLEGGEEQRGMGGGSGRNGDTNEMRLHDIKHV